MYIYIYTYTHTSVYLYNIYIYVWSVLSLCVCIYIYTYIHIYIYRDIHRAQPVQPLLCQERNGLRENVEYHIVLNAAPWLRSYTPAVSWLKGWLIPVLPNRGCFLGCCEAIQIELRQKPEYLVCVYICIYIHIFGNLN